MWERYSLIGLGVSFIILLVDLYLLRKRRITGRGFVFWFLVGLGLGLVSGVPTVSWLISLMFGTQYVVSGIMGAGFLFLLSLLFYLDYRIYKLEIQFAKLAMELSVARYGEKRSCSSDAKRKKKRK